MGHNRKPMALSVVGAATIQYNTIVLLTASYHCQRRQECFTRTQDTSKVAHGRLYLSLVVIRYAGCDLTGDAGAVIGVRLGANGGSHVQARGLCQFQMNCMRSPMDAKRAARLIARSMVVPVSLLATPSHSMRHHAGTPSAFLYWGVGIMEELPL